MSATTTAASFDIQHLAQAMRHSSALDAVPLNLSDAHWVTLANYMQPVALQQGQVLIEQGVKDRTVYFVESGTLTVHYEDAKELVRIAVVGAGSLLGEGAFFSHLPRSATVNAGSDEMGLRPQVLVVDSACLTPRPRKWPTMVSLKRCSRSFKNSLLGPCSQLRHTLSAGSLCWRANASAALRYTLWCKGTFLSGSSALPKWWVMSFSLVICRATTAGSSGSHPDHQPRSVKVPAPLLVARASTGPVRSGA